jgi:folate-binding protein YgfZ
MLTALGPLASAWLGREVAGGHQSGALDRMADGDLLRVESERFGGVSVVRTGEVAAAAFDVFAEASALADLLGALRADGGVRLAEAAWDVLRVEAGRPAWGSELSEDIIPVEAGIHTRVVDYGKGCFTGQEVLIRIRDRGHVNRVLRGLLLGAGPLPEPGTALFHVEEAREVGRLTSVALSPSFGEGIALGYVRREVSPPNEVRLGPDGARVRVRDLETDWRTPSPTGD